MRTRVLTAVLVAFGLSMFGATSAQADDHEVTFSETGPVDLSGSDHATGNAGEHVAVGSVDLGEGEWTVTASVRLFVPDVESVWKNSQGCGLYSAGIQLGGAGGSSGIWTATADGKEVVLDTFLVPPDWEAVPIVLDGPATVVLECFIDQSHSGAELSERVGMSASDITIRAVRPVAPEVCEWDAELLADDEKCVEPDQTGQEQDTDIEQETDVSTPAPVPTAVPAGSQLPDTGVNPVLIGLAGAGLVGLGVGGVWMRRRFDH